MNRLSFLIPLLFISQIALSQDRNPAPFLLDKEVLSGLHLRKIDLKDEPEKDFHQKMLFNGKDIMVFVVSTETWNNKIENYGFDEYVFLLNGQSIVKPASRNAEIFNYGDHFFVPKNFRGSWEINAGENLHYELSVISKARTDSTVISKNKNYTSVDRAMLSGAQLSLNETEVYEEVLREGVELKLSFKAEQPQSRKIDFTSKETLIHLLSGVINFTDKENQVYTYYTGDFFIMPSGIEGDWESKGHGLVKYLTIEKSDKE